MRGFDRPARILKPGGFANSYGGLYNPGAWLDDLGKTWAIVRRESAYPFVKRPSIPPVLYWLKWPAVMAFLQPVEPAAITIIGHHADARLEDFRPILHQGYVYVVHTIARDDGIKPGISILHDGARLERYDDLALPISLQPVEKNWVLASDQKYLYLVYSLDPLVVFQKMDAKWQRLHCEYTGWEKALGKPPRNSCNLVQFAGGWLGWWHTILDQWYVQGAYWLDASFSMKARTGVLFDGQDVRDGFKPGVLYLSSQVYRESAGVIHLYFGEGDAFSSTCTVTEAAIRDALRLEDR